MSSLENPYEPSGRSVHHAPPPYCAWAGTYPRMARLTPVLGLTRNHLKGVTVVARLIAASLRTFVVGVAWRLKRLPLSVGKGGFAAGRSKLRSLGAREPKM
jgi:hypothetical protein